MPGLAPQLDDGARQRLLNAVPIPSKDQQYNAPRDFAVTARLVWAQDGEESVETLAVDWSRDRASVLVLVDDPRLRVRFVWLSASDVVRRPSLTVTARPHRA